MYIFNKKILLIRFIQFSFTDFEQVQDSSNQNQNSKQVKIDFMIRMYNQILSNLNDISKLRVVNELDRLKPEVITVVNLKKPAFEALRYIKTSSFYI